MDRTEIQDLGEFILIAKLTEGFTKKQPSTLLGVGDDAAVVDPLGKSKVLLRLSHRNKETRGMNMPEE